MSKKITHKEVEKAIDKHTWLTGKLADWSGNDLSDLEEGYDFITNENIIINYIKQQEEVIKKQEKLLDLYRDIYNISPLKNETKESYWARVKYLDNRIMELEK